MRPICPICEYILDRCVCQYLCQLTSNIPIIIIREPKEKNHSLGTVKLLQLCLKNIVVIDTDSPDQCQEFIQLLTCYKKPILLYPFLESKKLDQQTVSNNLIDCLIFLDGTWKKTNRLFFRSEILQNIPRYHIDLQQYQTKYRLRKSSKEISLSTIEAVSLTLNTISKTDYSNLLETFDKFIDHQIALTNKKKGV